MDKTSSSGLPVYTEHCILGTVYNSRRAGNGRSQFYALKVKRIKKRNEKEKKKKRKRKEREEEKRKKGKKRKEKKRK